MRNRLLGVDDRHPYAKWQTDAISAVQQVTLGKPMQYLIPLFDGLTGLAAQGTADARGASATATRPDICSFGGEPSAIQQGQAATGSSATSPRT